MSRSLKKGDTIVEINRPGNSSSVSRQGSTPVREVTSGRVDAPVGKAQYMTNSTPDHEVTDHRVDAPVGKGQYITNSTPDHEVTDHRVDAPVGKGQYITDSSSEIVITDKGTSDVAYTLVVKNAGPRLSEVKKLLGVSVRSNLKIPYRISGSDAYKASLFELAKKLMIAGADIDFTKDIIISFPLI